MGSTSATRLGRRTALGGAAAGVLASLAGCGTRPGGSLGSAAGGADRLPTRDGAFLMSDGARLPYRAWLPAEAPRAVMLALHGFGDSRDAWEWPAPTFAAAGVAVYAPDQRGFGETADRGLWAGAERMTEDAASLVGQLSEIAGPAPVFVIGESMGGAVAMRLAATRPSGVAGYVLVSPAVWGRASMGAFLRGGLWVLSHGLPGAVVWDGGPVRVRASDNLAALRRLSSDPLTLHGVRFATLRGMVDLMDDARAAAPVMPAPTLVLYGGRDEVIPSDAMAAMWRALPPPPGVRRAFYPDGYHLLLRDHASALPIGDILAWMRDPRATIAAEPLADAWLATLS